MASTPHTRVTVATLLALALFALLMLLLAASGHAFGREPASAWTCDDTRYTQLVPRGKAVVGASLSAPPGCAR